MTPPFPNACITPARAPRKLGCSGEERGCSRVLGGECVEWGKRLERHAAAGFVNLFLSTRKVAGEGGDEGETGTPRCGRKTARV